MIHLIFSLALALLHVPASGILEVEEQIFLAQINDTRIAAGLVPVTSDEQLTAAAHWMAQDMAEHQVSHVDSLGRTPGQRLDAFGYASHSRGENVAAGYADATTVFHAWATSPEHHQNMLNGRYQRIGIARVYAPGSTYTWYWVTTFGSAPTPNPVARGRP